MSSNPSGSAAQDDFDPDTYWHRQCDREDPHGAHLIEAKRCDHEHNVWCWGVPEPGSIEAQVAALQPGQRVRVTFEGVVNDPTDYPVDKGKRRAVSIGSDNGHVVLRYTGGHPASAHPSEGHSVRGKVVPTLVAVEVVATDE